MTAPAKTTPKVRHEEFCLPRPGETEPRIESYFFYGDDTARGGRPKPTHRITRCIECGAQTNQQIGA
jgi:hypothetical protein